MHTEPRPGGSYRGNNGRASQSSARPFVTHHVASPPPVDALRKVHPITSSAIASTPDGMVRLSVLAVLKLIDAWRR